jgi:hypothetical protein
MSFSALAAMARMSMTSFTGSGQADNIFQPLDFQENYLPFFFAQVGSQQSLLLGQKHHFRTVIITGISTGGEFGAIFHNLETPFVRRTEGLC